MVRFWFYDTRLKISLFDAIVVAIRFCNNMENHHKLLKQRFPASRDPPKYNFRTHNTDRKTEGFTPPKITHKIIRNSIQISKRS